MTNEILNIIETSEKQLEEKNIEIGELQMKIKVMDAIDKSDLEKQIKEKLTLIIYNL
jgi:hypothetical protein